MEEHAFSTYDSFLSDNEEVLKQQPAPKASSAGCWECAGFRLPLASPQRFVVVVSLYHQAFVCRRTYYIQYAAGRPGGLVGPTKLAKAGFTGR